MSYRCTRCGSLEEGHECEEAPATAGDVAELARWIHALHWKLGKLLLRDLNDATDAWYRPHPGGLLEDYLNEVDELADRFGVRHGEEPDRFFPEDSDRG